MNRIREWAALGGACVPPLFIVVVTALTLADRAFLDSENWSAIHRTKVEWPSLLELGPDGWIFVATLVICGLLVVGTGVAMLGRESLAGTRLAGAALVISGLALVLEGFRPDDPALAVGSWHNMVHQTVYPLIPVGACGACLAVSSGRAVVTWSFTRHLSAVALAVFIGSLAAAFFYDVAQLARYFLFGAMLLWFQVLTLDLLARSHPASARWLRKPSRCSGSTS